MSRLSPDRLGLPRPSQADDRLAFQRLAALGPAERALHALVSEHGLEAAAESLGVEPEKVMGWIRAGEAPESLAGQAGPRSRGVRYPRELRVEAVRSTLPARVLARKLGCGHQTILRWRREVCCGEG